MEPEFIPTPPRACASALSDFARICSKPGASSAISSWRRDRGRVTVGGTVRSRARPAEISAGDDAKNHGEKHAKVGTKAARGAVFKDHAEEYADILMAPRLSCGALSGGGWDPKEDSLTNLGAQEPGQRDRG
jgi:hypothetical protein